MRAEIDGERDVGGTGQEGMAVVDTAPVDVLLAPAAILEGLPDAVVAATPDGRIVFVNELAEEAARGGAVVVATSHEPELSVPMADAVVTMAGGAIVECRPGGRSRGVPDVA